MRLRRPHITYVIANFILLLTPTLYYMLMFVAFQQYVTFITTHFTP